MLNVLLMLTVAGLVILLAKIRAARHRRELDEIVMRHAVARKIATREGERLHREFQRRMESPRSRTYPSRATPASASDPMDLLNPLNPISPISVYSYSTPDTSCNTSSSYDSGSSSDSSCSSDSGSW